MPTTWAETEATTYWGEPCFRAGIPVGNAGTRGSARWQGEIEFVIRDGRPVVAELHVYVPAGRGWRLKELKCLPPGGIRDELRPAARRLPRLGLTGRDLRQISLLEVSREMEAAWREYWGRLNFGFAEPPPPPRGAHARRRGQPLSEDAWARVSLDYLEACKRRPGEPLVAMVEEYRREPGVRKEILQGLGVRKEVLRDRVRRARQYGWLSPAKRRGEPGAEPGPKLRAWLDQHPAQRKVRKTKKAPRQGSRAKEVQQ